MKLSLHNFKTEQRHLRISYLDLPKGVNNTNKIEEAISKRLIPKEWNEHILQLLEEEHQLVQKRKQVLVNYKERFENEITKQMADEVIEDLKELHPEWFL